MASRWALLVVFLLGAAHGSRLWAQARQQAFERIIIDANFPGGYQVEVADLNGDGRPDIVALGGGVCAWYENPSWTKRIITTPRQTPGIISSATADLDGDGKAEVAIAYEFAMSDPHKGQLGLAVQGARPDAAWTFRPLRTIGSIHRLRFGDLDGSRTLDLVVAPIFGVEARPPMQLDGDAPLLVYPSLRAVEQPGQLPLPEQPGGAAVVHGIDVRDLDGDGRDDILAACARGVAWYRWMPDAQGKWSWSERVLVPGRPADPPRGGSSEVKVGRLRDGRRFLATIDPWHGNEVAVWPEAAPGSLEFGPRAVLDDTLDGGHALWVADTDRDGDDEVFAGHRGKDHRVALYRRDAQAGRWNRTVLDWEIAAQDLRGGDLDGDGVPDVVAIGGATRNVVWYRPVQRP